MPNFLKMLLHVFLILKPWRDKEYVYIMIVTIGCVNNWRESLWFINWCIKDEYSNVMVITIKVNKRG